MEENFSYMEDAADKICHALINDPDRWIVSTYSLLDIKTKIDYWIGSPEGYIINTWNGNSNDRVFSDKQGKRIYDAFQAMLKYKESEAQKRVLKGMCSNTSLKNLDDSTSKQPNKNKTSFWKWLCS
jgi:hypothetical protein